MCEGGSQLAGQVQSQLDSTLQPIFLQTHPKAEQRLGSPHGTLQPQRPLLEHMQTEGTGGKRAQSGACESQTDACAVQAEDKGSRQQFLVSRVCVHACVCVCVCVLEGGGLCSTTHVARCSRHPGPLHTSVWPCHR
jgi:hypothetical protein